MQNITLNLDLSAPFGNLYRNRHVLLIAVDKDGKILTGQKPDFYPKGITRLLGGGVDTGETFELAAIREVKEEMGVIIDSTMLTKVGEITVNARVNDQTLTLLTAMFYIDIREDITAGDDVADFTKLSLEELYELADAYEAFSVEHIFVKGDYSHSWQDYGKVYGPIHRYAADYIQSRS